MLLSNTSSNNCVISTLVTEEMNDTNLPQRLLYKKEQKYSKVMAINSIQNSQRSSIFNFLIFFIHFYFIYSPARTFPGCIITVMVWSVAANQWGGITESDFPQALGQAQFWPYWEQWMDGSMPRLGKPWKEEVPCLPAAP